MKKSFGKRVGWTCMGFVPLIVSIVLQLGLAIVYQTILSVRLLASGTSPAELTNVLLEKYLAQAGLIVLIYQLAAMLLFGLWYYLQAGKPKIISPAKVFTVKGTLGIILMGVGLSIFANGLVFVAQYLTPDAVDQFSKLMEQAGLGSDIRATFSAVLIAPIGEELLCRGLIFHYASKAVDDLDNRTAAFWIANVIQALCFGIMHMNLIQGTYAFFLGLGLGWLRRHYDSLYPCMLCHFVINFLATFVTGYVFELLPMNPFVAILVLLAGFGIIECSTLIQKRLPGSASTAANH